MTHEELLAYEDALKKDKDYESSMEQKYDEGKAEGLKEGEDKKAIEIAKAMLQEGVPLDFIQKVSGLSLDQIEALQKP